MKTKLNIIFGLLLLASPVFAHRLDEYLQAIIVSIGRDHIRASMRLIPGTAVSTAVISAVDSNGDGVFSETEQWTYAQKVLRDLSLSVDGQLLKPRLETVSFPTAAEMREGLGEIHIEFAAGLLVGKSSRTLVVENHHEAPISVYLMNTLVPQDRNIQLIAQRRNENQSYYRVDYVQSGRNGNSGLSLWRMDLAAALAPFAGVPSMFHLGMRHIAEGTDHLLFLIALLLPAPLLAVLSSWATFASVRHSLIQILRVVTAFTLGHSLTLALGATGLVSLPSRLVEVLVAFSILVSALHALRPLFPGREPIIAALFGLIHGLAFATTLQNLGVGAWQRIASILGFNLGIEAMQLVVVGAILPSLIILSRMPVYKVFRFGCALFAGFASLGWIAERLLGVHTFVDVAVDLVAQHGAWIAASLLVVSVILWLRQDLRAERGIVVGETIQPAGLKASAMNEQQRAMLLDVTSEWAGIINNAYAPARMTTVCRDRN